MSTRATYRFTDERGSRTIYKHHDGYPEGGYQWIANALPYAWPSSRFEADEMAAAFVAGNKELGGGGVYLTDDHEAHGDTEHRYNVTYRDGSMWVERSSVGDDWATWTVEESGTLADLIAKHCKDLPWASTEARRLLGIAEPVQA